MYYVEKQPCVKLHAWPQVQFVIDELCSRRRINNSFNVSDNFMWCFLTHLSLSSLYAEHVSWPPGPWKLSRYDLRNPRCWSDGIALFLPCLKSVILSKKQLNSSCLIIYHYINFFWLHFLARWSKVSVWTVRQKSTFRFWLASLASKMHHAKVSWSLIHTSAPMGAFFIPVLIFLFFLFEHLQWAWRSTQFVSVSVYQSMYSRQQTESENFAECSDAAAMSTRPWECESINYRLMPDRAAKKDSGW